MKNLFILLIVTFLWGKSFSQECIGFKIIKNEHHIDEGKFLEAFKKFDYERYRPKVLDYKMVFSNGIEVVLFADNTLINNHCKKDLKNDYPAKEFLEQNIAYFMYSARQGVIMAVLNTSKN